MSPRAGTTSVATEIAATLSAREGAPVQQDTAPQPPTWYHATAEPLPPFPALQGEAYADAIVIGAGFTGLAAALVMAERGLKVAVLEAGRIGAGGTGRNGGQFHSGQRQDQWVLEKWLGRDDAKKLWTLAEDAKIWLRARIARHAIRCDLRSGLVHADHKKGFVEESRRYVDHLREAYRYPHVEALDRDRLQQLVRSDGYFGGWIDRDAGQLHPLKLAHGFARAATQAGATIYEQSRVVRLRRGPDPVAETAGGSVRAKWVVVAGDGLIEGLEPAVAARVLPIASTIAVTEPLGRKLETAIPGRVAVSDSRFVVNYFRGVEGGRLLFGGGESYSTRPVADPARLVRKAMAEVFPELAASPFSHAWSGVIGITRTRLPFVRRLGPNIVVAAGYSGQGVLLAPYFGALLAEVVLGTSARIDLLSRLPVPAFPGGRWMRKPLLIAAMSYYALRDRL